MRTFTIFGSVITSIVFISNVHADNNSVTQNELAAIYVLSEICPNLIGNSSKFTNGYQQFVKSYLPNESNPVEMLNQRAKSPNFQKYLIEERKAAKAASISENRQICEEVQAYAIPEKKEPIQNSTYTPSSTASSSMGASFLTGLLKTAVGVAVARQTGNNALGAQVALASTPEELEGLTNQAALEARQHSEAEARKKQEAIRNQQARQLQEQQAAMQRAQQSSYGTFGSSSGVYSNTPTPISTENTQASGAGKGNQTSPTVKCVSSTSNPKNHSIQLYNGCSQPVSIAFCYTKLANGSNKNQYMCHSQSSYWSLNKISYFTQWPGTFNPGATMNIAGNYNNLPESVVWAGCVAPYILPIMDSPNSAYCRNPNK